MYDSNGYYAGHCVVFPLKRSVFQQVRDRKMVEGEIKELDLINYRTEQIPIFYVYSMYADCNENNHYMFNPLLNFLRNCKDYLLCGLAARPDGVLLLEEFGLQKIWEETGYQSEFDSNFIPVFMEGRLNT
jgi:hypothetical protein